jgi:hypothetical protein
MRSKLPHDLPLAEPIGHADDLEAVMHAGDEDVVLTSEGRVPLNAPGTASYSEGGQGLGGIARIEEGYCFVVPCAVERTTLARRMNKEQQEDQLRTIQQRRCWGHEATSEYMSRRRPKA